nr:hypothetical protein [Tanacetum cinerariifolium]
MLWWVNVDLQVGGSRKGDGGGGSGSGMGGMGQAIGTAIGGSGSGGRAGGTSSNGGGRGRRGSRMASRGGRGGGNTRGGGMTGSSIMGILNAEEDTTVTTSNIKEATTVETSETTELGEGKAPAILEDVSAPAVDKGKVKESVADEASVPKRKRGRPPSHVDGIRIYHKNHGDLK